MTWHAVSVAHVNFPVSEQVIATAASPPELAILTSYGLLLPAREGQAYTWICPLAASFSPNEDPSFAIAGERLLVGSAGGLFSSTDAGCTWTAAAELSTRRVNGLVADPNSPDTLLVLAAGALGEGGEWARDEVWESRDNGESWGSPRPLNAGVFATTLATDFIQSDHFYVGAMRVEPEATLVLHSNDRGMTWTAAELTIAPVRGTIALLAAHPRTAGTVTAGLRGVSGERRPQPDTVFISSDYGSTFENVLSVQGRILSIVFSEGGDYLFAAVADPRDGSFVREQDLGLWRARTTDYGFERVRSGVVTCVSWIDGRLVLCTDPLETGFDLGESHDLGDTVQSLVGREQFVAPDHCGEDTDTLVICAPDWRTTCERIRSGDCGAEIAADGGNEHSSAPAVAMDTAGCQLVSAGRCPTGVCIVVAGVLWLLAVRRAPRSAPALQRLVAPRGVTGA